MSLDRSPLAIHILLVLRRVDHFQSHKTESSATTRVNIFAIAGKPPFAFEFFVAGNAPVDDALPSLVAFHFIPMLHDWLGAQV